MTDLTCVEYLEEQYLDSVDTLLQDPLNQDIIEYIKETDTGVRFAELKEEFVETGIRKQDLEKNVYKLQRYNIISVTFTWAEDEHLRAEYSYNSTYNENVNRIVESAIDSDSFF